MLNFSVGDEIDLDLTAGIDEGLRAERPRSVRLPARRC